MLNAFHRNKVGNNCKDSMQSVSSFFIWRITVSQWEWVGKKRYSKEIHSSWDWWTTYYTAIISIWDKHLKSQPPIWTVFTTNTSEYNVWLLPHQQQFSNYPHTNWMSYKLFLLKKHGPSTHPKMHKCAHIHVQFCMQFQGSHIAVTWGPG